MTVSMRMKTISDREMDQYVSRNEDVTKQTKIKIAQTLVFPIVTYGSES